MAAPRTLRFELSDRIGDAEVSPASIPLGVLKKYSDEVAKFLAGSRSEVDVHSLPISIVAGSLGFEAGDLGDDLSLWGDIARLEQEDSLQSIDPLRAKVLQEWQQRARTHPHRRYSIVDDARHVRISVSAASNFRHGGQDPWFRAERYLRGKVVDIGGKSTSNLHIVLENGKSLTVAATEQQLRDEKENHVYHDVVVRVSVEEHLHTGQMRDARLLGFERRARGFDAVAFEEFVRQGTTAWNDVDDPAAWVRAQRGHEP